MFYFKQSLKLGSANRHTKFMNLEINMAQKHSTVMSKSLSLNAKCD
jgi:hypothetical protein